MSKTLLSIGTNLSLLGLRNAVFAQAGYRVRTARTGAQATNIIAQESIDARNCGSLFVPKTARTDCYNQRQQQLKSSVEHLAPRSRKSIHSQHADSCDFSSCISETRHQNQCGPAGREMHRRKKVRHTGRMVGKRETDDVYR
jgi:hypothetical protein